MPSRWQFFFTSARAGDGEGHRSTALQFAAQQLELDKALPGAFRNDPPAQPTKREDLSPTRAPNLKSRGGCGGQTPECGASTIRTAYRRPEANRAACPGRQTAAKK